MGSISFQRNAYPNTVMGRELCIVKADVDGCRQLFVATTHLESPCPAPPTWDQMYSRERVVQAKEALNALKAHRNVVFGGDMNWDDKLDGIPPLPADWCDAWLTLRPNEVCLNRYSRRDFHRDEKHVQEKRKKRHSSSESSLFVLHGFYQEGLTYDSKENPMLTGSRLRKRLDRIFCCLEDYCFETIEIVGTKPIPGLTFEKEMKSKKQTKKVKLPVLPSDHFGLLLKIRPKH